MSYDEYDEYDDYERGGPARLLGIAALVIGIAALVWFVAVPRFQDDSVASTETPAEVTTDPESTSSDTAVADTTAAPDNSIESDAVDETSSSETTTADAVTTTASVETTPRAPQPVEAAAGYPTLPDGSPVPVLAVFDTDTITISGVVANEDAAARLELLAIANSKFPDAEVVSTLTFDPAMPSSVGIRVIEMNSVRFPESSADLLPEHLAEIDRAGGILSLFPNVSVLVIGHADQRGNADTNFAISEERARSVATYLVSTGIDPARVSSRAVGDLDLLALDNDAQSFALNRRTEFVFYGLLTDPE